MIDLITTIIICVDIDVISNSIDLVHLLTLAVKQNSHSAVCKLYPISISSWSVIGINMAKIYAGISIVWQAIIAVSYFLNLWKWMFKLSAIKNHHNTKKEGNDLKYIVWTIVTSIWYYYKVQLWLGNKPKN